jgi:hypothetical protein
VREASWKSQWDGRSQEHQRSAEVREQNAQVEAESQSPEAMEATRVGHRGCVSRTHSMSGGSYNVMGPKVVSPPFYR